MPDNLPWGEATRCHGKGEGQTGDIEKLEALTRNLWLGKTFCAHAPGAMEPLMSSLNISALVESKIDVSQPKQTLPRRSGLKRIKKVVTAQGLIVLVFGSMGKLSSLI